MRTEDGHIIQKCLDGDAAAFGLLVDKYKGSVYALAYAKLGDFHDAQDMTQEVFLKAYQKLRTLKRWDKFLSWLYAITSNSCKDFLRSKASRPDGEYVADQEKERFDRISIDSHHEGALHQTLREALSELPEIHRQVLSLHYLGGLSCREIAQFLGISPHAIAMRLSRARAKLRKEMLTMIQASFDGQKLHSAFTLNIVEMIRRTQIQLYPQVPVIPVGIAAIGLLTLSMLCLITPFNQLPAIGKLIGAPIPSETRIMDVGEIPVDVVMLSKSSVISGGDGKKDLMQNSRQTNGVQAADIHTEAETGTQNQPIARLGNGIISEIVYSPDGKLIAAAGAIGIWLYDAVTLTEVGMMPGGATTIAFSPDGQTLASGRWDDGTVHLWNVSTEERVGSLRWPGILPEWSNMQVPAVSFLPPDISLESDSIQKRLIRLPGMRRGVASITFAPDGETVAVGHIDGRVVFWYIKDRLLSITLACGESTRTMAFSPDGRLLASGGSGRTIKVWSVRWPSDSQSPFAPVRYFEEHEMREHHAQAIAHNVVSSMAFSPDGKTFVSARAGKAPASLWDVATQTKMAQLIDYGNEVGFPSIVAFSPDGAIIVTAGNSGQIRLWDAQTQRRIGVLRTDASSVSSIVFHPDGKTLASLSSQYADANGHRGGDMVIRIWDVENRTLIAMAQHHNAPVETMALQPNGVLLASGHQDGAVVLWNMQTRDKVGILGRHDATVQYAAFSPDGKFLATSARRHVLLWDILESKQIADFGHNAIVKSVAFNRDGRILACADDTCIRLWDTQRKRELTVLGKAGPALSSFSRIQSLAISPDGRFLASGGIDNMLRLWDIGNRQEIFTLQPPLKGEIYAIAFSPNSDVLASAGTHKEIHLWSVAERTLIGTLNTEKFVRTLAFDSDGHFLAVGVDAKVRVWNMETRAEAATLEGCLGAVSTIAFGGDGKTLVASSRDGAIRVWDTSGLGSD